MVAIQIYSAGTWAPARMPIMSPAYAATMLASLRERGAIARTVAAN